LVGPAVSTFYTSGSGASLATALQTFFTSVQSAFPNASVSWDFPAGGEIIDSASGHLVGAWSGGSAVTITAAAPGSGWASGVGTRIVWNTAGVVNFRRVRGSTFMVPLGIGAYDSDGTIVSGTLTVLRNASAALLTSVPTLSVWSRPPKGQDFGGGVNPITSATVPDKVSWLRSRRT